MISLTPKRELERSSHAYKAAARTRCAVHAGSAVLADRHVTTFALLGSGSVARRYIAPAFNQEGRLSIWCIDWGYGSAAGQQDAEQGFHGHLPGNRHPNKERA